MSQRAAAIGWPAALVALAAAMIAAMAGSAPAAATTPVAAPVPVRAAAPQGVTVTVMGIRATKDPTENVDPPLQPIVDELRRSNFNSFRLVANDTRSVPVGTPADFPLIEDYALRIQPERDTDETVRLTLSWIQAGRDASGKPTPARVLQRLTLDLRKGKYFLSGGWKLKEGALIGAIAVK